MAGVRVQFSIPNDMNDHPAPNSHDKDAQITEIVAALVAESPADLDSEIALRCAGDTELEEAVRSLLETRMGVEVPAESSPEDIDVPIVTDQAPTEVAPDVLSETLDLELESQGGVGETVDLPIGGSAKSSTPVQPDVAAGFGHIPTKIADFAVEKLLGSGGMGSVYLAKQMHPEREVAVKVMKVGFEGDAAMQRFEFEIETLARLVHPSIAELYEAGVHHSSDGDMPYVAMEYVLGARPITSYAKDIGLDIDERLRLFRKACDGVGFGHARGVIHRDLKPPNILVDEEGNPKIIDFGVARAAEGEDALSSGQVVGTLRYMSPEQAAASNDIDTSTDVYSLGLILYELLTQKSPYMVRASTLIQARMIIERAEVPLLSKACPEIPAYSGDLEMICAKALEKDPARRYRSANELGDDIQRYLDDEPVVARPPSTMETLRRLSRKHKPVVAMIGVTVAVVIGALVAVSVFAVREQLARKEAEFQEGVARMALAQAETERARLERLALVQGRMLATLDASNMGGTLEEKITSRLTDTLVAEGADTATIEQAVAMQHEFMAKFGPVDVAVAIIVEHMIEPTYRDLDLLLSDDPQTDADIRELLAELNQDLGRLAEAEHLLQRALELRTEVQGPKASETLRAQSNLGSLLFMQGRNEEAMVVFEEVLENSREVGGTDDPLALQTLQNLGAVMAAMGRVADAERYLAEALEGHNRTDEDDAWMIKGNLGVLKLKGGDINAARALLSEAHREAIATHGTGSIEVAEMGLNYADVFRVTGNSGAALELISQSLQTFQSSLGRSHPLSAKAMLARGSVLLQSGDYLSAQRDLREAWMLRRSLRGMDHHETLEALGLYSTTVAAQENYDQAIPLITEFVDVSRRVFGKTDTRRHTALLNLGVSFYKSRQFEEAVDPLLELIEICSSSEAESTQPCQVAAPLLLTVYNELAEQHPDGEWAEKARKHQESF